MEAERASHGNEPTLGVDSNTNDVLLIALVAGFLWGVIDAVRVGASPLLSIAAATSVSGLCLGTWLGLRSLPWFGGAAQAVAAGTLIAVGPLSVFGRMLAASTHHRPLGAATFAVVALGVVISCVLPTLRVFALVRGTAWERGVRVFVGGAGVVSLAFGLWQARELHLGAALAVGAGALGLALWLAPKLALVERWRAGRLATRLTFGTLFVAAIWLASEPMTQSSVSIPLGLWTLALEK